LDTFSHGGKIFRASRELGLPTEQILDFSANINPLGFPGGVPDVIKEHIKDIIHYPDQNQRDLLLASAKFFSVAPENVLPGNGSVELIHLIIEALRPGKVLIPSPTFSEYGHSCRSRDVRTRILEIPAPRYTVDENLMAKIAEQAGQGDLVIMCNPNNPTGQMICRDGLKLLLDDLERKSAHLLVDEAFMDFIDTSYSMLRYIEDTENLIILRSLTKFFALPGLRIGFALSNPAFIEKLNRLKDPWNINTFAGVVAPYVMKDHDFIQRTKDLIFLEKEWLWQELGEIPGFYPLYPEANYVFVEARGEIRADVLSFELNKRGILIRECANYPFLDNRHFRVAVKDRESNTRLINAIREIIGGNYNG